MLKLLRCITLALLGAAFSGCATLGLQPEPPRFQIDQVALMSVDFRKASFVIDGTLLNENFFDVSVNGFDYEIHAGDLNLATGTLKQAVEATTNVPAKVSLTFDVNFKNFNDAKKLLGSKIEKIELLGNIRYSTILGEFTNQVKTEKEIEPLFNE
jgi:LEA14-like dessication related protein